MKYINNYINIWNEENNPHEANDPQFIAEFTAFAKNSGSDQWEFEGDNGYCGHTALLHEHPAYLPVLGVGFEFAYGKDFIKVFTNMHHGFWSPEYINLAGDDAAELLAIIKDKLNSWAGFESA